MMVDAVVWLGAVIVDEVMFGATLESMSTAPVGMMLTDREALVVVATYWASTITSLTTHGLECQYSERTTVPVAPAIGFLEVW